jgi:cobalt-precorrin 5A hydrolase
MAAYGVGSVAEAAALACAGPDARLLVPRIASARATCAIARGSAR